MNALFAVSTTTGRIRKQNQDRFYLNGRTMPTQQENCSLAGLSRAKEQVFSVCDGMGGEEYGEIAAQLAVEALGQMPPEALRGDWSEYLRRANDLILRFARERQVRAGTTFAGLSLRGNQLSALNVGDSRIYLIREGKITQLSRDHTEFQAMVEAGIFAPSDFHKTSAHNRLTQYLGVDPRELEPEPHRVELKAKENDRYVLCTDGLYGAVSDEDIQRIAVRETNPAVACDALVRMAEEQGSRDNITVLLVCLEGRRRREKKGFHGIFGTRGKRELGRREGRR